MVETRTKQAADLMEQFAERTGLTERNADRRYLWTDAFAVCNFIALRRATKVARWGALASKLVERVHQVLGPHHDVEHPTAAGLRIGKKLPERRPNEPFDERLEWDRDGQYFHYLTKWIHALGQLARDTNQPKLSRWACELGETAHRAFVYDAGGGKKRMYWKMSIDLKRPLVPSMGQHDPLDGYVTYLATCSDLIVAIAEFAAMIEPRSLATADPLGIGGLLVDAYRLQQVIDHHGRGDRRMPDALLTAALVGLRAFEQQELRAPAQHRLAFRELGLALGLAACESLHGVVCERYLPLRKDIEGFWLDPANRANDTWREHEDINEVMLATCLVPDGFLREA